MFAVLHKCLLNQCNKIVVVLFVREEITQVVLAAPAFSHFLFYADEQSFQWKTAVALLVLSFFHLVNRLLLQLYHLIYKLNVISLDGIKIRYQHIIEEVAYFLS